MTTVRTLSTVTSCVVIGAGVVGAAAAAALGRRGRRVTLVDQAPAPGAGTSATTFAWINANRKTPPPYQDLNAAGVAAHHELAARAGADRFRWFHPTGHLEWADEPAHRAELAERVERLAAIGYAAHRIEPAAARRLEPDLRLPDTALVAHFPDEGYCHPAALIARLLGEARASGAELVLGDRVVAVEPSTVRLASGRVLRADTVLSCAGRDTEELLAPLGVRIPLVRPARGNAAVGFLAETEPAVVRLAGVVTTDALNLRPAGGGRLMLQALDLDAAADPAAEPEPGGQVARELGRRLAGLLPAGAAPRVASLAVGRRVLPGDGLTIAGRLPDHPWLAVVATHSGVTLAPLLGELMTAELLDDIRSPLLAGFRPERFAAGTGGRAGGGAGGAAGPAPVPARRPGEQ
ncbi:NAD(P)/FAD-dependent oxidoreductase [Streptomyces mayteni]